LNPLAAVRFAALATSQGQAARTILAVRRDRLTYLELAALVDLAEAAREVEQRGRPGVLVEAGCALGGSALVLAAAKERRRPLQVYDVFDTIPPPSAADGADAHERFRVIASGSAEGIGGKRYYGYERDLLARVTDAFRRYNLGPADHNVALIKGLFEKTLTGTEPVALAHLDCDWYASVMTCLENLAPRLVPGGRLVIDDYGAWSGCRKAVDEYFGTRKDEFEFQQRARLHILRRAYPPASPPRTERESKSL
jgi:asparagine synthase (glutamine-hydrolysing)